MTRVGFSLRLLMLLCATGQAPAQAQTDYPLRIDYPPGGMLHHQTEPSVVSFTCSPLDGERIRCEFTQFTAYVVQGARTADQQIRAFESSPPSAEECAAARAELAGVPLQRPQDPLGGADQRERLGAVVEYCETGRTEALRAIYAREYERWQKTCTVSAHHYTQTMRRVPSDPKRWVTEPPPYGECRLHQVADFYQGSDGLRYVAAYKVLNKSARSGVIGCHEIREHEAVFGPGPTNAAASRMTCETIHFEPGCWSPEFPCLGGPSVVVQ
jgi:hypothetical protein